jgi:hypothetical protein
MNPLERREKRHDVVTIPIVWVTFVLSLFVHLAALFVLLPKLHLAKDVQESGRASTLAVDLAPPPTRMAEAATPAPPTPPAQVTPQPPVQPPRPKVPQPRRAAPKAASPPVIAQNKPSQATIEERPPAIAETKPPEPAPPTPPREERAPVAPPPTTDLASYIEARRRARGEASTPSSPSSDKTPEQLDIERRDRIVASNLGLDRTPTFGRDAADAGGIFQIKEIHYDAAEFYFFGFNKDIRRKAKQLIEVRRGSNADIRIAIVRKMIEIIRGDVSGDFEWISHRLGRHVTLSARPEDNAGLEDFIMRDLFPDSRGP